MEKLSLARKLVAVMKEVRKVPKRGRNDYHGYKYALEEDILTSVREKLLAQGVVLLTSVESALKQGDVTEVQTLHTFIDADTGEQLTVKGYGQGQDKGDKGGYKAVTGSVKQMLCKNLLIPTGDDPERPDRRLEKTSENGLRPATPEQMQTIQALAQEVSLDVQKDIYSRMRITSQPTYTQAEKIIARLRQLQMAGKN